MSMSKSNDISNMATLEDHDTLADSELDAVTGGSVGEFIDGVATAIFGARRPTTHGAFDPNVHGSYNL
jgi:hypothetical protein